MYTFKNEELEKIIECPVCKNKENHNILHENVEDLAFKCINGTWNIYKCCECESLYLNPRPLSEKVYNAYSQYFTHKVEKNSIRKLENEIIYHWLSIEIGERINSKYSYFFKKIRPFLLYRYPLEKLLELPKGKILDIGCGDARLLEILNKLGWETYGIEIDDKSASIAREKGINVKTGTFELINTYDQKFDYIMASHVIEHIYDIDKFIFTLINNTNKNGTIFISYPNPNSLMHKLFGKYWWGIDAPRHVALPSIDSLEKIIRQSNSTSRTSKSPILTFWGSYMNKFNRYGFVGVIFGKTLQILTTYNLIPKKYTDQIQLEIVKK